MEDIRLAIGLICFVTAAVFALFYRLLQNRSRIFLTCMAAVVVAAIVAYIILVWGQLWIVQWIPLPSVIILANWFPPLLGALAAIVWLQMKKQTVARRMPIMIVMTAGAIGSLMWFMPGMPPQCEDNWNTDFNVRPTKKIEWPVCIQSTPHTCSAAAAATILNTIGIQTTEQEMAHLCLTKGGTTWLGLYHGLSTKLRSTKHRIEFFEGSIAELEKMAEVHPVLLCCELQAEFAESDPRLVNNDGWHVGVPHTIVYFGKQDGLHVIGDPSRGFERWENGYLDLLWNGQGLKIAHYGQNGEPTP